MKLTREMKNAGWSVYDDDYGTGIQKPTGTNGFTNIIIPDGEGRYDLYQQSEVYGFAHEYEGTLEEVLRQGDPDIPMLPDYVQPNDPYTMDDCPHGDTSQVGLERVVFVKEDDGDVVACFLDMEENYGIGNGGYKMVGFRIVGQTTALPLDYAHTNVLATEDEWLPVIEAMKRHTGWCEEVNRLNILNHDYL